MGQLEPNSFNANAKLFCKPQISQDEYNFLCHPDIIHGCPISAPVIVQHPGLYKGCVASGLLEIDHDPEGWGEDYVKISSKGWLEVNIFDKANK